MKKKTKQNNVKRTVVSSSYFSSINSLLRLTASTNIECEEKKNTISKFAYSILRRFLRRIQLTGKFKNKSGKMGGTDKTINQLYSILYNTHYYL